MYAAPIYFSFDLVDAKVEEPSIGDNIASAKKDDARRQIWVPLVVLLCVAVLAVVLQGIIYPTDSSIDHDQVTSVELLKVSASTL